MLILELRLLGGSEGTFASGETLRLPTRKAWALLCYLALHPGRKVSREQLAGLLWGDRSEEQARASLRQTLHELRHALGEGMPGCLAAHRNVVALNVDKIGVDVLRLERLACSDEPSDLAKIASLYGGELLDGLSTGEPCFDDWLMGERARLRDLACGALDRLASAYLELGRSEAAIETARSLIRVDPLRERAHRLLMRSLAMEGRRSEARKHFRDLEALFQAELGVAPDAETRRLHDELMQDAKPRLAARTGEQPGQFSSLGSAASRSVAPAGTKLDWRASSVVSLLFVAIALAGLWLLYSRGAGGEIDVAPPSHASNPVVGKPSIAVLPFASLSSGEEQERFADGLTEDLITALSKSSRLVVIARSSTAGYKNKPVKVQAIAEDLDVRYLLEGSVQNSGDRLRITAQLIDAGNGHHLWSEQFDRKAREFFVVQDDIVRRVLIALQIKLTDGEHARIASRGTTNLRAWLLRVQAVGELYKFTREGTTRTRQLLQAAHELDPDWSRPIAGLAWAYWWEARNGWTDDREEWIRRGMELAENAIKEDPQDTLGYMELGNLYQLKGDHERAIKLREKAVSIAPSDFQANWGLGGVLIRAGQAERAVEVLKHALRLSPRPPASVVWALAHAQLFAGRFEDAVETAKRARQMAPNREVPRLELAAAYAALGRMKEARASALEVLRIDPNFSVSQWRSRHIDYKDKAAVENMGNKLLEAGLPN